VTGGRDITLSFHLISTALNLALASSRVGCNIGGMVVNNFAHDDYMVLLSPSCYALQDLVRILEYYYMKLDIICNTKKIVCMAVGIDG